MTHAKRTRAPWEKFNAHAELHAKSPHPANVFTLAESGRWAKAIQTCHPDTRIHEPRNDMQSTPYVLFVTYSAGPEYDATERPEGITHPYRLAEYCEGDTHTYRYRTAEARDRALYLLVRAV